MKVVICWVDVSGYASACWHALARRPGVELFVVTHDVSRRVQAGAVHAGFDARPLVADLPHRMLSDEEFSDAGLIAREVIDQRPDVVVLPGWSTANYNALPSRPELRGVKFVMAIDTAWNGSLRQVAGRWAKGAYFRRLDGVVVAGERSHRLARWLGFREDQIIRGVYGLDYAALEPALARRLALPAWPRRFVFVGRYVDDKGVDILLNAYARYRAAAADPWTLSACGRGPRARLLAGKEGVTDLGFVQPRDLPCVFAEHGVFVLASRFEPWGVVIAEAAAAGLPVIATEACGASADIVRSYYNGLVVPTGDVGALTDAMTWMDENHARLEALGRPAQSFGAAYAAEVWAERWEMLFRRVLAPLRR